jgi:hypothetical protein
VDTEVLEALGPGSFRRVPQNRNAAIKHEVVVQFPSVRDRDLVKGAGFKLAGSGLSMRLELPSSLMGPHRILSNAAQALRKSRPGTRTYVKFDDDTLSLALEYKVEGGHWARIRPEEARGAIKDSDKATVKETTAEEFSSLLIPSSTTPATGANAIGLE